MFDTMTILKISGGVLGAWLILLLGKWGAEEIYHAKAHGEQSYVIEVETAEAEPEEELDMDALMANAVMSDGQKVFRKCTACHKVDGTDGVGPHLNGVFDREIAGVEGFGYSGVLAGLDGNWDLDALMGFLENPKGYAPGTTMGFSGLKKPEDRADVIAYLMSLN